MSERYKIERDENGRCNHYAWPGGYQINYYTDDEGMLCANCVDKERERIGESVPQDGFYIIGADIYWEGPDLYCDHCNSVIESEYGDPDAPEDKSE